MRLSRRGRRRLILLCSVMLLGVITLVVYKQVSNAQRARLTAESRIAGMAAYEAADYPAAISNLSTFYGREKNDIEAIMAFADARSRVPMENNQHVRDAIGLNNAALRLIDDDDSDEAIQAIKNELLHRLLTQYKQMGMLVEIESTSDRILAVNENDEEALWAKAQSLYSLREYEDVTELTERLIGLAPAELRYRELHLESRRRTGESLDSLIEVCRQWSEEAEGNGQFDLLLAGALMQNGQREEAKLAVEAAVVQGTNSLAVLRAAVTLLDQLEEDSAADELIAATRERFPDQEWVREVELLRFWQANRIEEAEAILASLDETIPNPGHAIQRLKVLILAAAGHESAALQLLESMRQQGGDGQQAAWIDAIDTIYRAPEHATWRDAIVALRHAALVFPNDSAIQFFLGDALDKTGEYTRALAAFERAWNLDPNWIVAGQAYGNALLNQGRIAEAYEVSLQVLRRSSGELVEPYVLYVRAYLAMDYSGIATRAGVGPDQRELDIFQILETIQAQLPARADIASLLAEAYGRYDRPQKLRGFVDALLSSPETSQEVLLAVARTCFQIDEIASQPMLDAARDRGGETIEWAELQANAHLIGGDPQRAVAVMDDAIASAPAKLQNDPRTIRARARVAQAADVEDASSAASMERLLARAPNSPEVIRYVLSQPATWTDESLVRRAIEDLKRTIGLDSEQVRLAEASYRLKFQADDNAQRAQAIVKINEVLAQSPDSLPALMLKADAWMMGERPDFAQAIEALEQAVDSHDSNVRVRTRLIRLLQEKGDYNRASFHLDRLTQLNEDQPELRAEQLQLYRAQGRIEDALPIAADLIGENSTERDQLVLASMYRRVGRFDEAEKVYDRLLLSSNASDTALWETVDFYASRGREDEALALVNSLPVTAETPQSLHLGRFHFRQGNREQAARLFQQAIEDAPNSAVVALQSASFHLQYGERDLARREALRGLSIDPGHQDLQTLLAVSNLSATPEARREAIDTLIKAGSQNEALIATLEMLESVPYRNGQLYPSERNLEKARSLIARYPRFLSAWQLAAFLHADAGELAEATSIARRAVSRFPREHDPCQWATVFLMRDGRYEEAIGEAMEWRRRTIHQPLQADMVIAAVHLELNRPGEAYQQLEPYAGQFANVDMQVPGRLGLWVSALVRTGRFDQALQAIEQHLDEAEWRQLWMRLADDTAAGVATMVLNAIDETMVTDPDELVALSTAWNSLGRRTGRAECFDRADQIARLMNALQPETVSSLLSRGAIAQSRGAFSDAEAHYNEALRLDPRSVEGLNNLAFLLGVQGDRPGEAITLIDQALQIVPDHPSLMDTRARILLALDRNDDALQTIQSAAELNPMDVELQLTLAEAQMATDLAPLAARSLQLAESLMQVDTVAAETFRIRFEDLQARLRSLQSRAPAQTNVGN